MNIKSSVLAFLLTYSFICHSQTWQHMNHGFGCMQYQINKIIAPVGSEIVHVRGTFLSDFYCADLRHIASWNGYQWDSLQCVTHIGGGRGMLLESGNIWAGGKTPCVNDNDATEVNLFRFENGLWHNYEMQLSAGYINDIIEKDGVIYASGAFGGIPGDSLCNVVSFSDGIFSSIAGSNICNIDHVVNSIVFYHDTLFAGGKFNQVGRCDNFASVYDLDVHQVAQGLEHGSTIVERMIVHRDTLFIGGIFYNDDVIGIEGSCNLLYYDGSQIGTYLYSDGRIRDMKSYNNKLYVAGTFSHLNGIPCNGLAELDGLNIHPLITEPFFDMNNEIEPSGILSLEIRDGTILIGGTFHIIGESEPLGGIAFNDYILNTPEQDFRKEACFQLRSSIHPNSYDIIVPSIHRNFNVQLISASGVVLHEGINSSSIDLVNVSNGIYIVRVYNNDFSCTQKILKN
jgi:hypothetical protein